MDETVAVVVEVQTTRSGDSRQRAWPCYVTSARAVHGCKAYMLVIATSPAASAGSVELIQVGQPYFHFRPFVVGGHASLPDPGGLVYGPEWTMLNILTGRLKLSNHDARIFALDSIAERPPDLREEYASVILNCSSKKIRQALEELMSTTFKSPFFETIRAEAQAEGRAAGRAEGEVNLLLAVLKARGFTIGKQVRARISSCKDEDRLELWATRAITANALDEVFAA